MVLVENDFPGFREEMLTLQDRISKALNNTKHNQDTNP